MDTNELIRKTAEMVINYTGDNWNLNIRSFDWVPGVGLYGIFEAYKATNDKKYYDFLENWIAEFLPHAYDQKTVNSTAPLLTVLNMYEINKNPGYLKVCEDIAEYIVNDAPITREGGLEHTVTEAVEGFSEQIWADTLFMVCIFLAKMGKIKDKKYSDFAIEQLKIHYRLLWDESTHLYYHGWNCAAKNHMSAVRWGRANAWIILSGMEILNTVGDFPGRKDCEQRIKQHAEALKSNQGENGEFRTIINDPEAYPESSAAGGILAGMKKAVKAGILKEEEYSECINKGMENLEKMIADDGSVMSVSTGTPVMPDAQAYKDIPRESPTLYGQALTIAALAN